MPEISLFSHNPELWDAYVSKHPKGSVYHTHAFRSVVEKTYGHKSYYLAAWEGERVVGVLPLFHINSRFLGNALVSLPFCDYGGVLADSDALCASLLDEASSLLKKLGCSYCELRQTYKLSTVVTQQITLHCGMNTEKVRMILELTATTDALFSGFPAKLRSQIRKPQKEGCITKIGGIELLDDFYTVFAHNMRDLGSPVHPKAMMRYMLSAYGEKARLFVVYHSSKPVGCSLVAGFGATLVNPWASFNRNYGKIAPNMMLYWEMLSYAINSGYRHFDFGRSTVDEGTYKFKTQWGALPQQLFWYRFGTSKQVQEGEVSGGKKELFIKVWQKIPLPVTKIVGPVLRKQLHL
jgi:FemAB-related protein (PEP-CTERM system-associated)